ncbi:NAD(P)-binding protein [Karstenula rhodostoma CBS 690.94]|uniref:D-xylose 1-dehydrogenase (NADP(+), D-xylono-1,5-lactone-forming) n=1 Tax=Karstenula rhodostoma CBS 690.94 TaxID=1392251 RepID=A0A9P4PL71_9PLEO|nr:NAD(P)-binding protein [Karstenula rhodostoma CBS 690.94]
MEILGGLRRNWRQFNPPVASKQEDALKFGILGAANITPMALILPAKSHSQVIIHAIAARDKTRATVFAKKHGIPVVKNSYEEILDDPAIDVVYIPLPTGLHLEWALKALVKGKHSSEGPILMEAFHSRFALAWQQFLAVLDPPNISHAIAKAMLPSYIAGDNVIRFDYSIGGGTLLDLGTYPLASIRDAFSAEPEECIDAKLTPMAPPREKCDHTFYAKFRFPNGGTGEINGTLRAPKTHLSLPNITVTHKPVPAPEEAKKAVGKGAEVTRTRKFEIRDAGSSTVKREYTKTDTKKAYTFREIDRDAAGEIHWSTYRYMLEEFVNKVKGRKGSGVFVSHEESIAQSRALDMIYEKSRLGLRPTSKRVSEVT